MMDTGKIVKNTMICGCLQGIRFTDVFFMVRVRTDHSNDLYKYILSSMWLVSNKNN